MTDEETLQLAELLSEHIAREATARLTVSSDSMEPLIRRGDVVGLRKVAVEAIQPGRIVTFRDPQNARGVVTHRVAARWQEDGGEVSFLTRGDRNLLFDPAVPGSDMVGEVVWRIRNDRRLALDRGSGLRLSEQMAGLSEADRHWISGLSLADLERALATAAAAAAAANEQAGRRRYRPAARLRRYAGLLYRRALAALRLSIGGDKEME